MLFDRGTELPQATVRRAPHQWGDLLAGDLKRWLVTRWGWLRPRTLPVLVAFVGMLGMLEAVSYLSQRAATDAEPPTVITGEATPYVHGQPDLGQGHLVRLVGDR